MYRFLFSRQWLTYLGLAILFAVACVLLSRWQMGRLAEAQAVIDLVNRNYDAAPVPFAQASDQFGHLSEGHEWQQVSLRGSYEVADTRVVRNRPLNGQPGYEVVVPLRLDSGQTVVVDRGWLPIGNQEQGGPDSVPAPPSGEVSVVVRLRPSEPTLDRGAPAGQLASIDLPTYAGQLQYPIMTGSYGLMANETPAASATPASLPKPQPDDGTHLSYALQWLAFGVLMFIGFGYAARQQARNRAIDAAAEAAEAADAARAHGEDHAEAQQAADDAAARAARFTPKKRKRPTAEEEEDAILDAQGFR
ncbi:SURF1 family protein [Sinomonas sp. ASV322]|uniref:SURF1 family cytochrome oxidase biogenesis protein n=1 Tax=Sinomonas sp. ASV322 TaxID=3041920 RepID=UPI0027DD54C6|nr:SURF1 family protein [Sinomonas sp. ASV322]MDQ4500987.1 SURF1 family protein [Sinomonas sp. ASV322]